MTIPADRPRSHPMQLRVMMGLTVLLYLMLLAQSGTVAAGASVVGG